MNLPLSCMLFCPESNVLEFVSVLPFDLSLTDLQQSLTTVLLLQCRLSRSTSSRTGIFHYELYILARVLPMED